MAEYARLAEQAGFGYVACGEHLFSHRVAPNPFVQLAAAAGATTRIRLVSTVSLLPLYPAALAAKLAATLDQVSGGRFELGVGAGGEHATEFQAAGIEPLTRFARLDEALEVLELLFTGAQVSFAGRFTRLEEVRLDPPVVQPGGPPIWIGGRRTGALRRAARFGHVWLPYLATPDRVRTGLEQVRSFAVQGGRDPEAIRGAAFVFAHADTDAARARADGIAAMSAVYRRDFAEFADRYLVLGSPAEVAERLFAYQQAGAATIVLRLAISDDDDDFRRALDTMVEQVLPLLQPGNQRDR